MTDQNIYLVILTSSKNKIILQTREQESKPSRDQEDHQRLRTKSNKERQNKGSSQSKPSNQNQSQIRSLHRNRRRPSKTNSQQRSATPWLSRPIKRAISQQRNSCSRPCWPNHPTTCAACTALVGGDFSLCFTTTFPSPCPSLSFPCTFPCPF